MGCDIHLHTEIKINGKWEHYSAPSVGRNYALFEKMAGVRARGESKPISEPKGLPDDISVVTALDAKEWGRDGHSHSYLTASEIAELDDWFSQRIQGTKWPNCFTENWWGYFFGNSWGGFVKYPEERPEGVEDVRFVFWFDN